MPKKKELTYLDVAEAWPRLAASDRARRLKQLPPDIGHEFFFDLSAADQSDVVLALPPAERRPWIRLLAPDDVADVIQAAPAAQRPRHADVRLHSRRRGQAGRPGDADRSDRRGSVHQRRPTDAHRHRHA